MYCLDCGKKFSPGRPDKKFCDEKCRLSYNNREKENENKEIRIINIALKRNRRILKKLLGEQENKSVEKWELERTGFTLAFHTHFLTTKSNFDYTFCYNYGYRLMDNGKYFIIKSFKD